MQRLSKDGQPANGVEGEEQSLTLAGMLATLRRLESKLDTLLSATLAPTDSIGEFLTVAEAAAYVRLSRSTLYKMKHLHVRRGRALRFRRSDLDRYFRSKETRKAGR
jgi:excisionase family DNA binding protein